MEQSGLAIVIPAYCEERTIRSVAEQAVAWGTVLVIDDCSTDRTAAEAEAAGATVVTLQRNTGYEGALSCGFKEAVARGYTHVVTLDADGEHEPSTLGAFRSALLDEGIPLVLGVRARKQRMAEVIMGWYVVLRYGAHDILCGMKGYDLALWHGNGGFDRGGGIGTELAIYALRRRTPFRELPVGGTRRQDAPRFDRRWRANWRILRALFKTIVDGRGRPLWL